MFQFLLGVLVATVSLFLLSVTSADSQEMDSAKDSPKTADVPSWKSFELSELQAARAKKGGAYLPFLKVPSLRLGLYELAAGARDGQSPHKEDEVYQVLKGRAVLEVEGDRVDVKPGSVVFVKAGAKHRFVDIKENLSLLVFFSAHRQK